MSEADRIKDGIEALGITQLEFAERLGVSVKTVNNWCNGRFAPTTRLRGTINKMFNYHLGKRNSKEFNLNIKSAKKNSKFDINDIFSK